MKKKRVQFIHDEFDTTCFIDDGHVFISAVAHCEDKDKDYWTNLGGEILSHYKALEKYYHIYCVELNKKIEQLENLSEYLFPKKFFNKNKVSKDTIFGVNMVKARLDKKIQQLKDQYTEYREYELAMGMKVMEYVLNKNHLFEKLRERKRLGQK